MSSDAFRKEDRTKVVIGLNGGKTDISFGLRWGPPYVSQPAPYPRNEALSYDLPAGSVATFVWK